jgi:hypothetical protein
MLPDLEVQTERFIADIENNYYTTVKNSHLLVFWNDYITSEYVNYIGEMCIEILKRNNIDINILIGSPVKDFIEFNNNNKTLHIHTHLEHSLIQKGTKEDESRLLVSKTLDENGDPYYVDVHHDIKFSFQDIIIQYSIPNMHHIQNSGHFYDMAKKSIYIAASLYKESCNVKEGRDISILTTFSRDIPRRLKLINSIKEKGLPHKNISGVFKKEDLAEIYKKTKILVNIHQDHIQKTFEELRVISALQCGVIVISENSALNHLIPYNHLIIWSSYENIVEKTKEVLENYDQYHEKIFGNNNACILNELHDMNLKTLEEKIISFL